MLAEKSIAADSPPPKKSILLIDDDKHMHNICKLVLEGAGYRFLSAKNGKEGFNVLKTHKVDLILLDYMMPEMNGLEFYEGLKRQKTYQTIPVIVLTVLSDDHLRQHQLLNMGVALFLKKPFGYRELLNVIENVLLSHQIQEGRRTQEQDLLQRVLQENERLRSQIRELYNFENVIGSNPQMKGILDKIRKVSQTDARVMFFGESGTGKELLARCLHANSRRRHQAFVPIYCLALKRERFERDFLGHGNSDGPPQSQSVLQLAQGGSLFLDEICDLSLDVQAEFLEILREGHARLPNANGPVAVDVRFLAATTLEPHRVLQGQQLRKDFFYELCVIPIRIPPLRERKDDIPLLVEHFVRKFSLAQRKEIAGLSPEAMDYLCSYPWPGNVRELQHVIERVIYLSSKPLIQSEDLPDYVLEGSLESTYPTLASFPFKEARREWLRKFERYYLADLLTKFQGNISKVAQAAHLHRKTVYRMLQQCDMDPSSFSSSSKDRKSSR